MTALDAACADVRRAINIAQERKRIERFIANRQVLIAGRFDVRKHQAEIKEARHALLILERSR